MQISSIAREIVSVTPETTVMEAIDVMNDHEVSAVGVVEDGRMAGIFTLRDVARKVVLGEKDARRTRLRDVMTTDITWASGGTEVRDALKIMIEHHIHHLPVVNDAGEIAGIVSFQYLLRDTINTMEFNIASLNSYICNNGYGA